KADIHRRNGDTTSYLSQEHDTKKETLVYQLYSSRISLIYGIRTLCEEAGCHQDFEWLPRISKPDLITCFARAPRLDIMSVTNYDGQCKEAKRAAVFPASGQRQYTSENAPEECEIDAPGLFFSTINSTERALARLSGASTRLSGLFAVCGRSIIHSHLSRPAPLELRLFQPFSVAISTFFWTTCSMRSSTYIKLHFREAMLELEYQVICKRKRSRRPGNLVAQLNRAH
ncbi:hypothetical protein HII31_04186, partial [Pseudocercospora fuligena]